MRNIRKSIVSVILLTLMLVVMPIAVIADTWQYYTEFTVSDNSSTARTALPVLVNIKGQNLIDGGYVNTSANNTRVTESTTDRIFSVSSDYVPLFVPSLLANQSRTYKLYTGNSPEWTTAPIIVGNNGYITTTDTAGAPLEPGSDFAIEVKGYIDTTAVGGNITYKAGAYRTYIGAAENITSSINQAYISETLTPNAAGVITNLTIGGTAPAATNWESVLTPSDSDETYVYNNGASQGDEYNLTNGSTPIDSWSMTVTVHCVAKTTGTGNVSPAVYLGGTTVQGAWQVLTGDYTDYSVTLARPGGGSWTQADITSLQAGVYLQETGGGSSRCTQVYVVVTYLTSSTATEVSVAGVSSGEHIVNTTNDGTNLTLSVYDINGALEVSNSKTIGGAGCNNTASDWLWMRGNAMPYAYYLSENVSGARVLHYEPTSMISGTILPDTEGSLQNGAITWWTNPTGIEIEVGGMVGYEATSASVAPGTSDYAGSYEAPSGWFATGAFAGVLTPELLESFDNAAQGMGMPIDPTTGKYYRSLMLMIMFGVAVAVGLSVLVFTGSVLGTIFTVLVVLAFGVQAGIIDYVLVFIVAVMSFSIFYLVKQH